MDGYNRRRRLLMLAAALAAMICGAALAEADVVINPANFPDDNFRAVAEEFDLNHDNVLSVSEIAEVTYIDCYNKGISDMTGIEVFTSLRTLDCSTNFIYRLDVSRNTALIDLRCDSTGLTNLDLSRNTSLQSLECCFNDLSSLDLSKNTDLRALVCASNQLETLDVSRNTELTMLNCCENMLETIDLRKNTKLTKLYCSDNMLSSLDISKNTKLTYLSCDGNQLAELNILFQPALLKAVEEGTREDSGTGAYIYSGDSGSLRADKTVVLITGTPINAACFPDDTFRAYVEDCIDTNRDHMLSSGEMIAVTSICLYFVGEEEVDNYYGEISNLKGIELFVALEELDCSHCRLASLDLSRNTALKELDCSWNSLASLDLSANTALKELDCSSNRLTALDVRNNIVNSLRCCYNQLTSLLIGENDALKFLDCSHNRLRTLDISGAGSIKDILYNGTLSSDLDSDYLYYFLSSTGSFYVDMNVDLIVVKLPDDCLRIPDSVTRIEAEAFRNTAATSVFVPGSVTFIGEKAFPSDAAIYGKIGYVQYWARNNGYYFVPAVR